MLRRQAGQEASSNYLRGQLSSKLPETMYDGKLEEHGNTAQRYGFLRGDTENCVTSLETSKRIKYDQS